VANLDHATTNFVDTKLIDNPLQTCAQLVVAVTGLVEHAKSSLNCWHEIFT
jgi:hypothetical protein